MPLESGGPLSTFWNAVSLILIALAFVAVLCSVRRRGSHTAALDLLVILTLALLRLGVAVVTTGESEHDSLMLYWMGPRAIALVPLLAVVGVLWFRWKSPVGRAILLVLLATGQIALAPDGFVHTAQATAGFRGRDFALDGDGQAYLERQVRPPPGGRWRVDRVPLVFPYVSRLTAGSYLLVYLTPMVVAVFLLSFGRSRDEFRTLTHVEREGGWMKCPGCGKSIERESRFCVFCGTESE